MRDTGDPATTDDRHVRFISHLFQVECAIDAIHEGNPAFCVGSVLHSSRQEEVHPQAAGLVQERRGRHAAGAAGGRWRTDPRWTYTQPQYTETCSSRICSFKGHSPCQSSRAPCWAALLASASEESSCKVPRAARAWPSDGIRCAAWRKRTRCSVMA